MTVSSMARKELLTEPVTGFGTRRQLIADLSYAVHPNSPTSLLVIFGLGPGLTDYADLHGTAELQDWMVRLASRLGPAIDELGSCYWPREEEFAALIHAPLSEAKHVLAASVAALTDGEEPYRLQPAFGAAILPAEASEPLAAIRLADQRLSSYTNRVPRDRRRKRD